MTVIPSNIKVPIIAGETKYDPIYYGTAKWKSMTKQEKSSYLGHWRVVEKYFCRGTHRYIAKQLQFVWKQRKKYVKSHNPKDTWTRYNYWDYESQYIGFNLRFEENTWCVSLDSVDDKHDLWRIPYNVLNPVIFMEWFEKNYRRVTSYPEHDEGLITLDEYFQQYGQTFREW